MVDKKVRVQIIGDEKDFDKSLDRAGKKASKFGDNIGAIARKATIGIAAIGTAITATVGRFAAFETEFSNVVTLLDESSFKTKSLNAGIKDLEKGLLTLRSRTGESFTSLNKGLFDLISAGVDAEKAIGTLEVATKLAKAGATDTSVAVDGLTSALNAYSMDADEALDVSEMFFTAQKFGKTTIEELASGFGLVGATASEFGVSLDEVLASVSAVTLAGQKTSVAYTGLKAVFANVAKPTKDAADEAARLGIQFDQIALKEKGLKGFFDSITQSAGFNDQTMTKLFGSVEALNFALALSGSQADSFAGTLDALGDATTRAGTFTDALAVKTETTTEKWKRFTGSIDAAVTTLGSEFAPVANEVLDWFFKQIDAINKVGGVVKTLQAVYLEFGYQTVNMLVGVQKMWNELKLSILEAVQVSINAVNDMVMKASEAFSRIPFVDDPFSGITGGLTGVSQSVGSDIASIEAENRGLDALREGARAEADAAMMGEEEKSPADKGVEKLQQGLPASEEEFDAILKAKIDQDKKITDARSEHEGKLTKLEEKEQKKRNKLLKGSLGDKIKLIDDANASEIEKTEATFGVIQGLTSAFGIKNKALSKAFGIAEASISIARGIAKAQELGFPANIIEAARVAAVGATQFAAINGAAAGGIVPGADIGKDTRTMAVRPGELIVPSQFVKPLMPSLKQIVDEEAQFGETSGGGMSQNVIGEFTLKGSAGRLFDLELKEDQESGIV